MSIATSAAGCSLRGLCGGLEVGEPLEQQGQPPYWAVPIVIDRQATTEEKPGRKGIRDLSLIDDIGMMSDCDRLHSGDSHVHTPPPDM